MATVVGYDQSVKKRATCRDCSAIIEYVLNEVQSHTYKDYSGCSDTDYFIICPNCSNKVAVKGY